MAKSVDVGTGFIVGAKLDKEGNTQFTSIRDSFFEIEDNPFRQKMLKQVKANFLAKDGKLLVIGEEAVEFANMFNANAQRPMNKGVISPKEKDAFPVIKIIIEKAIGKASKKGEKCYYSVPAAPIDENFDIIYHENVFNKILSGLGYDPCSLNEAEAIAYSELLDDGLTGIAISCGAGMINVSVGIMGVPAVQFSIARSGDWVDQSVATALDLTASKVQTEKEKGVDLLKPDGKIQEAISIYYGNLIDYVIKNVAARLSKSDDLPSFKNPVPIVVSGGTSLADNFIGKFKESLEKYPLPIDISEVKHANDPLTAVANGLLICASLAEEE